jgi:hypothetical protein
MPDVQNRPIVAFTVGDLGSEEKQKIVETGGRVPDDVGETHIFHIWDGLNITEAIQTSNEEPQNGKPTEVVKRELPSKLQVTITASDEAPVPFTGENGVIQDDDLQSQIQRISDLTGRNVTVTTRTLDFNGIVSEVKVKDSGKFDNTVPVDVQVSEIETIRPGRRRQIKGELTLPEGTRDLEEAPEGQDGSDSQRNQSRSKVVRHAIAAGKVTGSEEDKKILEDELGIQMSEVKVQVAQANELGSIPDRFVRVNPTTGETTSIPPKDVPENANIKTVKLPGSDRGIKVVATTELEEAERRKEVRDALTPGPLSG